MENIKKISVGIWESCIFKYNNTIDINSRIN